MRHKTRSLFAFLVFFSSAVLLSVTSGEQQVFGASVSISFGSNTSGSSTAPFQIYSINGGRSADAMVWNTPKAFSTNCVTAGTFKVNGTLPSGITFSTSTGQLGGTWTSTSSNSVVMTHSSGGLITRGTLSVQFTSKSSFSSANACGLTMNTVYVSQSFYLLANAGPPAPPADVTASVASSSSLNVSHYYSTPGYVSSTTSVRYKAWTAGAGGVVAASVSENAIPQWSSNASIPTTNLGGLTPGVEYWVTASNVSSSGEGNPTVRRGPFIPSGVPTSPTLSFTQTDYQRTANAARINYSGLFANGSAITQVRLVSDRSFIMRQNGGSQSSITVTAGDTGMPGVYSSLDSASMVNMGVSTLPRTATHSGWFVVDGLVTGTTFNFTIQATNANGTTTSTSIPVTLTTASARETIPGPPQDVTAVAGDSSASVTFRAPDSMTVSGANSWSDNKDIKVYSVVNGVYTFLETRTYASNSSTTLTVAGLTNGTSYAFTVIWKSSTGTGTYSDYSNTVIPYAVVNAPTITAVTPGNRQLTFAFSPPADLRGGSLTGYQYQIGDGTTLSPIIDIPATSPLVVSGLTNGLTYSIRIRAVTYGPGMWSTVSSGIPAAAPSPPVFSAVPADGKVTLVWDSAASVSNGSPITAFWYKINGGAWVNAGTTSAIVGGLVNGQVYLIDAKAVNAVGESTTSRVEAIPFGPPSAPQLFNAVGNSTNRTLSVDYVIDARGSVLTSVDYQIAQVSGCDYTQSQVWTGSWIQYGANATGTIALSGLGAGCWDIRVRGSNIAGIGPVSREAFDLSTVPSAPTSLTGSSNDSSMSVSFAGPLDNGGRQILRYESSIDGTIWNTIGAQAGSFNVFNLTNGSTYSVHVRVCNSIGCGTSATISGTPQVPLRVPFAPVLLSGPTQYLGISGGVKIRLTNPQIAPARTTISRFEVSLDNGQTWQTVTLQSSSVSQASDIVISNLIDFVSTRLWIRAVNEVGEGDIAEGTVVAGVVPGSKVQVTFDSNSFPVSAPNSRQVDANTSIDLRTELSLAGFKFLGWNTDAGATMPLESLVAQDSIVLYAIWAVEPSPTSPSISPNTGPVGSSPQNLDIGNDNFAVLSPSSSVRSAYYVRPDGLTISTSRTVSKKWNKDPLLTAGSLGNFQVSLSGVSYRSTEKWTSSSRFAARRGQEVLLTGKNFKPRSRVELWIFSNPTLLGTVLANDSGSILLTVSLPKEISLGLHTLQIEGVSAADNVNALRIPVIVVDSQEAILPSTGLRHMYLIPIGLMLLLLGGLLLPRRHRLWGAKDP